jgi:hypothetical protein
MASYWVGGGDIITGSGVRTKPPCTGSLTPLTYPSVFGWMDFKGLIKRILPRWTQLNLIITAISVVSAVIVYLTQNVLPAGLDLLQLTVVALLNMIFLLYWSLWYIIAVPPIVAGLYFSKENQGYYILAVQNVIAVAVLYALKVAFRFDLTPIIG